MNKQGKLVNGKVEGGIEWVKTRLPDGSEYQGATSNPVKGCQHRCRWVMPDGSVAICYAELVAGRVAQAAYPHGFEHHYWEPEELKKWEATKKPQRIFWDSMADLFGSWVPDDQIQAVLAAARLAYWHTFQSLTKNAPRLLKFNLPPNVWPGASMPPDFMMGNRLNRNQQERMLHKIFEVLGKIEGRITWISFEPLSWDVSPIVAQYPCVLRWAVIGAASNGPKTYQPNPGYIQALLDVLDSQDVPIFFKGNLDWSPWREDFPTDTALAVEAGVSVSAVRRARKARGIGPAVMKPGRGKGVPVGNGIG